MAAMETLEASGRFVRDETARTRLVLVAASLGTVFEWYDFFLYGSLAVFFGALFFPSGNETAGFLASLATFGAGFAVRPFGALVFGGLGDRIGRKRCFMITMVMMGLSTLLVGLLPTYAQVGVWGARAVGASADDARSGSRGRIRERSHVCSRARTAGTPRLLHQLASDYLDDRSVAFLASHSRVPSHIG
jgi:hypothetical protein